MNYNNETYPNLDKLIQKCENTYQDIQQKLLNIDFKVADLYNGKVDDKRATKSAIYSDKLSFTLNAKLNPKKDKNDTELQGIYIFVEKVNNGYKPVYIGISRTIHRRIRQHYRGNRHNEATFAYLMAKYKLNHTDNREYISIKDLNEQKKIIGSYGLIIIPEKSHYDMYFMEVYLAGKLKTKWNSFKTH